MKNGVGRVKIKPKSTTAEKVVSAVQINPGRTIGHDAIVGLYRGKIPTQRVLESLWRDLTRLHHPQMGVSLPLTARQKAMLATIHDRLTPATLNVLAAVIRDWGRFCAESKSYGAYRPPEYPTIEFLSKYLQAVTSFQHESAPVQVIAKKITTQVVGEPQDASITLNEINEIDES